MNQHHIHDHNHQQIDGANDPASLMATYARRAADGDADGLLALYESDAVFQPEPGVTLRGSDEIAPALQELASLHPTITFTGDADVVVVGDLAIVSNQWEMTASLPDGSTLHEGGLSADVVRRQPDGTWRVLIDQPRGATLTP